MQKNILDKETDFIAVIVNSAHRRRLIAQKAARVLDNSTKARPFVVVK